MDSESSSDEDDDEDENGEASHPVLHVSFPFVHL